jgi:hypothetical protein
MERIATGHQTGRIDDNAFHIEWPHGAYDMRAGADTQYQLMLYEDRQEGKKVGEINRSQILLQTPPNAIYSHDCERYRVIGVREKDKVIRLRREHSFNRTRAFVRRTVHLLHRIAAARNRAVRLEQCDRLAPDGDAG